MDLKYIVHENGYKDLTDDELKGMLSGKTGDRSYEDWMKAFCDRKYNSDFAKEMTRSVKKYLEDFEEC